MSTFASKISSIMNINQTTTETDKTMLASQKKETLSIRWLTIDEVANKMHVSRSTVYRWRRRGVIRGYAFNNSRIVYFNETEVDSFLSLNPITPTGRLDTTILV